MPDWLDLGGISVSVVSGGEWWLDAGAMFGIIPRPLWQRDVTPDDRNRIRLQTNCLLVRTPSHLVLIDTGMGSKLPEKEREIFQMQPADDLLTHLESAGVTAEEVTAVILTHLHMDHAGGASHFQSGVACASFPRAEFLVRRGEWQDACANRSTMTATYRPENLAGIESSGRLRLVEEDTEFSPEISLLRTPGHTPWHQSVLLRGGRRSLLYTGDVLPTWWHTRRAYNMAYDLEPYQNMQTKLSLLERAARESWWVVPSHDPLHPLGQVEEGEGGQWRRAAARLEGA